MFSSTLGLHFIMKQQGDNNIDVCDNSPKMRELTLLVIMERNGSD